MQTLIEDLKSGQFRRAYLLFGEEAFLKKSYKNRLKDVITGGDTMNYNHFEGKGLDALLCGTQADCDRGQRFF